MEDICDWIDFQNEDLSQLNFDFQFKYRNLVLNIDELEVEVEDLNVLLETLDSNKVMIRLELYCTT